MTDLSDKFSGPYIDKNIKGHIIKFSNNMSLEKAMEGAIARENCTGFVITEDKKVFYKIIDHDASMKHIQSDAKMKGHTSYIKKKN